MKNTKLQKKRGQGMTEYIIIVALIAVAAIGIITLFGDNIRALFGSSAEALAGNTASVNTGTKNVSGAQMAKQKRLNDFGTTSY